MDDKTLINKAESAIRACLKDISFLTIKELIKDFESNKVQADMWIKLEAAQNYPDVAVEVKKKGEPRFVREAVNQLLRYLEYVPNTYGLIVAPYISTKSAEICKEAGIGYIDLSGNCFLAFQQVYIKKEGKSNTQLEKKILKSLYYPKAERVLRVLLNNPGKTWKMESLAKEAEVSLGMCSKVKQRLEAVEWIEAWSTGFKLQSWEELLYEWQNQYRYSKNKISDFYSLKSETYIVEQLSNYCRKNHVRFALTMFSGASYVAPYTRFKRVYAYVENEIDNIKETLNLKSVPSGPNITLLLPYDEGVFYGSKEYDGIPIVSPIQLYLDLITYKGRGEEAAQFLLEKVLKPEWLKNQISDNAK